MSRHLAIFLPSLAGGGAEKVMLSLAERFIAHEVRCDLVVVRNDGQLRERVPPNVRLVDLGKNRPITAIPALISYLKRERPDTLLSTIFPANIAALIAGHLARTRRIVIREASHVTIDTQSSSRVATLLNRLAARFLYARANAVIAVSGSVRQSLLKSGYVRASQVNVIVNPADLPIAHRRKNVTASGIKTVLACGRLEPQKDYPTLLRAFSALRLRLDSRLVILGEGSLQGELEALASSLGILDNVIFAGFDSAAGKRMQEADVFAHTAIYEGMSNVLLEALAAGCPIVATDSVGGVAEILDDGRYGALVPVGDAIAVAKALEQVLRGTLEFPDPRKHLESFDPGKIADAYLAVLFPPANC